MAQAHDFTEHLDVARSRTIQGAIREGATVRSGAQLTVQGAFVGPIIVESDAILMVQGSFNGDIQQNDGTLILFGQASLDLGQPTGRLAVGVDSLITTDRGAFRLSPDGELIELHGSQPAGSFNVRTDRVCVYDENEQRFRSLKGNDQTSVDGLGDGPSL